jgi:hypothetical protein
MQPKLLVALAALALAGPGIAFTASMGSGGGGFSGGSAGSSGGTSTSSGGSSSGASSSGGNSGGGSSGGGRSGGGGFGGHIGGGGGSARGGAGSGFASRGGGAVAGYGIHIGPHNGGQGAPAIQALTHGAAHAVRVESAARALPVEDRMRPGHPGTPKVHPHVRMQNCFGGACELQYSTMPNLYCMDPRIDDLFSTPLDCPRAIKYRDTSGPGTLTR